MNTTMRRGPAFRALIALAMLTLEELRKALVRRL